MSTNTRLEYFERIDAVQQYMHLHLDEALDRECLAAMAGFSVVHFQRLFMAYVGETIGGYLRRLRMERAAQQLQNKTIPITRIALDCGFETHAAFSKTFRQYFGLTPSEFRLLPATAAAYVASRHIVYSRKDSAMQPVRICTLPDMQVLYARATELMTSPAFQTANHEAFMTLFSFLGTHHLSENVRQLIAIYPDAVNEGESVRFDAGVIFETGFLPDSDATVAYQTLSGGRWAVFLHTGPYDTLWRSWQRIYRDWLPESGETLRDAIPFEDYLNDPANVAAAKLQTEIYIPLV